MVGILQSNPVFAGFADRQSGAVVPPDSKGMVTSV